MLETYPNVAWIVLTDFDTNMREKTDTLQSTRD